MGVLHGMQWDRRQVTDPLACPECDGSGGDRVGPMFLACRFCAGRGWVGGAYEPAEGGAVPAERPPAWEDKIWNDPDIAAAFKCRLCLDSKQVSHVDDVARTLVTLPCLCVAPPRRPDRTA